MLGKEVIKEILDNNLVNSEIAVFDADQDLRREITVIEVDTNDEDETEGALVIE